jgi:hypothetical protein
MMDKFIDYHDNGEELLYIGKNCMFNSNRELINRSNFK